MYNEENRVLVWRLSDQIFSKFCSDFDEDASDKASDLTKN